MARREEISTIMMRCRPSARRRASATNWDGLAADLADLAVRRDVLGGEGTEAVDAALCTATSYFW